MKNKRIVEIYSGAYASGKSETAISRAYQYIKMGKPITLVDLDTVEPAYCLRPLVPKLEEDGIKVVAQTDRFGLGEAASYVTQEQVMVLKNNQTDIIIDVGHGASGLDILDILQGIEDETDVRNYLVVNTSKFETKDEESIKEYLDIAKGCGDRPYKCFDGLISNTHFGDETTKDDVMNGYEILKNVSKDVGIPIFAIGMADFLAKDVETLQHDNTPIWVYRRMMPNAMW